MPEENNRKELQDLKTAHAKLMYDFADFFDNPFPDELLAFCEFNVLEKAEKVDHSDIAQFHNILAAHGYCQNVGAEALTAASGAGREICEFIVIIAFK